MPAAQEGQDHDSKAVAVEPAAARTCLAGEACVGAASGVADSPGPREQGTMTVWQVARLSRPTFATDTRMSHSITEFAGSGCGHT